MAWANGRLRVTVQSQAVPVQLLAVIMVAAGVYHFVNPQIYVFIMPKYLPWHLVLVYISGFLEILFGAGLLTRFSSFAAWV